MSQAQKQMPEPQETKKIKKLKPNQMKRADFSRPDYRVIIDDLTTTREDVLVAEFWTNHGTELQGDGRHPFPVVELIWQDGSRAMEVYIMSCGRLWAKAVERHYWDFTQNKKVVAKPNRAAKPVVVKKDPVKTEADDGSDPDVTLEGYKKDPNYTVKFIPSVKWCVYRDSDGEMLIDKITDKEKAYQWMHNHVLGTQ